METVVQWFEQLIANIRQEGLARIEWGTPELPRQVDYDSGWDFIEVEDSPPPPAPDAQDSLDAEYHS
jgi:hypothetical protein